MIVVRKEKDEKSIDCYQDIDYFETNKPYNYVKEISRVMNEEYSEIQNSSKIYAMPSTWKPVPYKANVSRKWRKASCRSPC